MSKIENSWIPFFLCSIKCSLNCSLKAIIAQESLPQIPIIKNYLQLSFYACITFCVLGFFSWCFWFVLVVIACFFLLFLSPILSLSFTCTQCVPKYFYFPLTIHPPTLQSPSEQLHRALFVQTKTLIKLTNQTLSHWRPTAINTKILRR